MFNKLKNKPRSQSDVIDLTDDNSSDMSSFNDGISMPKQLMIGYYANIKKKDLETFIYSRAESNMSIGNSFFNIIKYEDGYIWELHEGGSGKGVLKSVIELLKTNEDVVIPIDDRLVKISRKNNSGGVSCYLLSKDDNISPTDGVKYHDSLTPVRNSGYGLFLFGCIFAVIGVISIFLSVLFKYVIYDKEKNFVFNEQTSSAPITQIPIIDKILMENETYVETLVFKNKKWIINKNKEIKIEKDKNEQSQVDMLLDMKAGNKNTLANEIAIIENESIGQKQAKKRI